MHSIFMPVGPWLARALVTSAVLVGTLMVVPATHIQLNAHRAISHPVIAINPQPLPPGESQPSVSLDCAPLCE